MHNNCQLKLVITQRMRTEQGFECFLFRTVLPMASRRFTSRDDFKKKPANVNEGEEERNEHQPNPRIDCRREDRNGRDVNRQL